MKTQQNTDLRELIEISVWQQLQDAYAQVYEISLETIDTEGNTIGRVSNPNQFCQQIIHQSPKAPIKCLECRQVNIPYPSTIPTVNTCYAGLITHAFPIIFQGEIIAHLLAGRTLSAEPQQEDYSQIAQELEIPTDKIVDLFQYVPITSEKIVETAGRQFLEAASDILELSERRRRQNKELLRLSIKYEIKKVMDSMLNLEKLLNFLFNFALMEVKGESGSLMLLNQENKELLIKVARGLTEEIVNSTRVKLGEGIAGWVAKKRRPLLLVGLPARVGLSTIEGRPNIRSSMCIPIQTPRSLVGILNVNRIQCKEPFSDEHLQTLNELSETAATSIENAKLFAEMRKQVITDRLTGLFNQSYFYQRLVEELKRAQRHGEQLSLIIMDIDALKPINDTYGHQAGDKALKLIADTVKLRLRNIDILARYGGDEFAVVLPHTSIESALVVAQNIKGLIEQCIRQQCPEIDIPLTVSMGIANWPTHAKEAEGLFKAADQALYEAKQTGKDGISVYQPQ